MTNAPQNTCVIEGVFAPSRYAWDTGRWEHPAGQAAPSGSSPWTKYSGYDSRAVNANACSSWNNNYKAHYIDNPTPGNQVVFGMQSLGDGVRGPKPLTYLYGASMWLDDAESPTIAAPQHVYQLADGQIRTGLPTGWVNDANFASGADASDPGLGMRRVNLLENGGFKKAVTHPCTGGKDYRCPTYWPYNENKVKYTAAELGEGIHNLSLNAADAVEHTTAPSTGWQIKVDRTVPGLDAEGYLFDAADTLFAGIEYDFGFSATDATSGLASVVLRDGTSVIASRDCRSEKDCGGNMAYTPPSVEGARTLQLTATDLAGNERTMPIPISVAADEPEADEPEAPDEELLSDAELTDIDDVPTEEDRGYCGPGSLEPTQDCEPAEEPSQAERSVVEEPALATGDAFPLNLGAILQVGGTNNRAAPSAGSSSDLSRGGRGWGLSDEKSNLFTLDAPGPPPAPGQPATRAINDLSINRVRKIIAWDVRARASSDRTYNAIKSASCGTSGTVTVPKSRDQLRKLDAWFDELRRAEKATGKNYEPMVSFELSKGSDGRMGRRFSRVRCALPTKQEYYDNVTKVLQRYRFRNGGKGRPRTFTAWNEPNGDSQPTRVAKENSGYPGISGLRMAGKYYSALRSRCRDSRFDCTVAAGDFLDKDRYLDGVDDYKKGIANRADDPPIVWALHPYGTVAKVRDATGRARRLEAFVRTAIGRSSRSKVWITETGGLFNNRTDAQATEDFCKSIALATGNNRVTRYYHYTLQGGGDFDTGLIDANGVFRDIYQRYAYYSAERGATGC